MIVEGEACNVEEVLGRWGKTLAAVYMKGTTFAALSIEELDYNFLPVSTDVCQSSNGTIVLLFGAGDVN